MGIGFAKMTTGSIVHIRSPAKLPDQSASALFIPKRSDPVYAILKKVVMRSGGPECTKSSRAPHLVHIEKGMGVRDVFG